MLAAVALHLWQSTLIVTVAWPLASTCRRNVAAVRLGVTATFSGVAAWTGGNLIRRMSSIMNKNRALPVDLGRFALLLVTALVAVYGPIASGIIASCSAASCAATPTCRSTSTISALPAADREPLA